MNGPWSKATECGFPARAGVVVAGLQLEVQGSASDRMATAAGWVPPDDINLICIGCEGVASNTISGTEQRTSTVPGWRTEE